MMDTRALFLELVTTIILLVSKPFSLFNISCIFLLRFICIIIHTWVELLRAAICFHVNMFWRIFIWAVALISLPVRVLTALQRERMLEMHLLEKEIELEKLLWNRKELEERLQMAVKERRMMEIMLAELEEENDQTIVKIELLEDELQDVKCENLRLKEVQGKDLSIFKTHDDSDKDHNKIVSDKYGIPYGKSLSKSSYDGSGITLQDVLIHKDVFEDKSKSKMELRELMISGEQIHPYMTDIISSTLDMKEVLEQQRVVALSQTLFSAIFSMLVGMIIFEAEDPCMPLVIALFTVVGISMKSVVQFFFSVKNKPAIDAIALLSFNWFLLGTLTYPTLPGVACMLTPWVLSFLDRAVRWLGFSL